MGRREECCRWEVLGTEEVCGRAGNKIADRGVSLRPLL